MSFINHTGRPAETSAVNLAKVPIWRRLMDAVGNGRRQECDRMLSDLIARNGGRLTDDVERQIAAFL